MGETRYALFYRFVETDGKLVVETNYFTLDSFAYALKEEWVYIGCDPDPFDPEEIEAIRKQEEDRFKNDIKSFWKRNIL